MDEIANAEPCAPVAAPFPTTQPEGGKKRGNVVSLLEGGYDVAQKTLGLARCVNAHVKALRGKPPCAGNDLQKASQFP